MLGDSLKTVLAAAAAAVGLAGHASADDSPAPARIEWGALPLPAIDGGAIDPASLTGKVVLVVNTASKCGFTPQYAGLEALWREYRDRGLVVLGVPSNDFGSQEPGNDAEVASFCEINYGVDFPLLSKQTVSGSNAHPFYRWAAERTGPLGVPRWNFHKILIARDGRLLDWYSSVTGPDSGRLRSAIERALDLPGS
ncbi:glutathione peroxidase [Magnetospirillum fulvum]|uniref:Glutathione peroxidase n=1 Tax=Magnetospirillum fulvum TaxID=1082 RepID=A0A1H6GWB5_MAGFU|nr:glutathione peroxidase [Magnetospirillum fulvum]SEH27152.1 glutathione peroxidase [Magnetospirillum fulvum]